MTSKSGSDAKSVGETGEKEMERFEKSSVATAAAAAVAAPSPAGVLDFIEGEHVLIVGGTGSLGNHLVAAMMKRGGIRLSIMSRDENKQWHMRRLFPGVHFYLGDMRDQARCLDVLRIAQPSIVIIAGALKHIDQCEAQPDESISTNILGVSNVARACLVHTRSATTSLKSILLISTDKACSPTNVYGLCKAISERTINQVKYKYPNAAAGELPKFLCVRYGNVLNSRGSIVPRFVELAADPKADHFPVTDVRMTRFFMTLNQSIDLIFHAIAFGKSGETWIPHVPAVKIIDLANHFAKLAGKAVKIVGVRPGEKIHECLINEAELHRTEKRVIAATGHRAFYVIASCLDTQAKANHDLKQEYTSEAVSDFGVIKPIIDDIVSATTTH